jgi:MSHA biogenesis protein MshQ
MTIIRAWLISCCFMVLGCTLFSPEAQAVIVREGIASGSNTAIPTDGSAGALTITKPAVAKPGMAMIVSIAARPSQMTWTVPAGWTQLSITAEQPDGGTSTNPGGMTLKTFYRIVGVGEPNSYTWTFANTIGAANPPGGGSAVGGMLVYSGLDTSASPLDATPTSRLNASGTTHRTFSVTTATPNAEVVSIISYLSAGSLTYSGALCGTTEYLEVRAPAAANAVGTTLQMGSFAKATAGATCAPQSTSSDSDTGIGHLLALKPSSKDLTLAMTRSVPLTPGGTASYTMTITNAGSQSEPGPLTIADTLPAGLTYASASGSGWSCSVAGQVVTCQKTGALAAGATATPLLINVSISGSASGVLTNTATASGTGGDGNTNNNTASDTYVIPSTPYAYYAMDEASWGTILDSSGNNRNATKLGTASATSSMPATPGSALTGSPGTCGAGSVPSGSGTNGVNTGITPNTLGNAGTIMFWYSGNAAWTDGTSRILFDASNEFGNGGADKHFFLAKDGAGRLVFALEDSNDLDSTATSPAYGFAANDWHHIAVSWDLPNDRLYLYLDGDTSPIATSTTDVNGVLGNMATLYLGAQRFSTIAGAPATYTANTANGYIDEVRLYNRALDPLEIEAAAALSHACTLAVDHYELSMPSTASACSPVAVTVTACADAAVSPCSNRQAAASTKTTGLIASAGTLDADATPTQTNVTFDSVGVAVGQWSYLTATSGTTATITLSGEQVAALYPRKCCPDGANCVVANSCSTTFTACSVAAANFNIVDGNYADKGYDGAADHRLYTKLAGWNEASSAVGNTTFTLDMIALKSGGTTETNYVGTSGSGKNVKLEIVDDSSGISCNASQAACAACTKPVVATINPATFGSGSAGYANNVTVSLGNTTAYSRLIARITDTNASPTVYGCSTDAFAVRPRSFAVTAETSGGLAMPASASGATGTPMVKAGASFTMNADTATAGYGGTPKLNATTTGVSDFLGSTTSNLLTGNFSAANSATGLATGTGFKYGEVGYFILASDAVYDDDWVRNGTSADWSGSDCVSGSVSNTKASGKYGCNIGSASTSWGRFIPDHFDTDVTDGTVSFTYSGQPFTVKVMAKNASGNTTKNYWGSYAEAVTLSDANSTSNCSTTSCGGTTSALGSFSNASIPVTSFTQAAAGEVTWSTIAYRFSNKETAPLETRTGPAPTTPAATLNGSASSLPMKMRATSSTVSSNGGTEDTTPIRAGRLRLVNFYGSDLLKPRVEYRAEYWSGNRWATNTLDSTTAIVAGNIAAGGLAVNALTALNAGIGFITFNTAAAGSYDIALDLNAAGLDTSCNAAHGGTAANKPWLQGYWSAPANCGGVAAWAQDPNARIRLGSPKAPYIYMRERY